MNGVSDEAQIRQLVHTWLSATKRGDIQAVLSLMTEDVVFLAAGQAPMIGKAAFAAAMQAQLTAQGAPKCHIDSQSDIQNLIIEGNVAFMWTALTVKVTPPDTDKAITRAGHSLTVLRKEQDVWRIARDANMLVLQV
jgi:uncharacterized protein (TIGR02246 family)